MEKLDRQEVLEVQVHQHQVDHQDPQVKLMGVLVPQDHQEKLMEVQDHQEAQDHQVQ